ncbi:SCP2 sterol-binding domain-containing protein [Hazenella coriacea]|uniref:Putative sterol carrier protein n=1 Tax=Hazenella coriacea TaxID=1179467 RepID=A0A4R3LAD0_9BACL|nr:SCP2 sterol-binding domain-containing protein [Hazenella coriacea]TCS96652.1 putative sterol carrier protein [Hazenella coriacea]
MSVKETLATLADKINGNPEGIQELDVTYQLDLNEVYQIRFHEGKVEVAEGTPWEAVCTLQLSDDNFVKLVEGSLNPTSAFMTGKLKIKGALGQALKLQSIFNQYSK